MARSEPTTDRPLGSRSLVLCYHAVSDGWPDPLAVSPSAFERQIRFVLRRRFRPVTAEEAVAGRRGVHVTFDDAYRSVLPALDVLERLGVGASVFACSAFAESGRPLLIPELRQRARGFERELATMDWESLRAISVRGFEVGSHTVTHPHLPRLSDSELRRELHDSRARISEELGRPCRFLAYPFGESDERVQTVAAEAGYAAAFALRPAGRSYAYAVARVDIYRRDGMARFALKTSPLGRHLRVALHSLRRRDDG
jgi:peptidoglycan/xylan/chitin deacetylase (PgdA/CDA1 family)